LPRAPAIECAAPPERVWALLARPERWHEWSPYVRGAEDLGSPEVVAGAEGRVVLLGGLRIPARIVEVLPGESWSWRVAGILVRHRVTPLPGGRSRLEQSVEGSAPAWSVAATLYAPLVGLIGRNLARVAARD
jgi:uncharacterized protein YndB with AHSA1/START domain